VTSSRAVVLLCGLCLAGVALFILLSPRAPVSAPSGLVVEEVEAGGAAALAGIREGDVIGSWNLPNVSSDFPEPTQGELRSPFAVAQVEIEQSPRADVRLSGHRAGRALSFDFPQRGWRMTTRPPLPAPELAIYLDGRRRIRERRSGEGIASWREAANRLSNAGRTPDAVWLMSRIAGASLRAGDWPGAQEAWETAIRQAAASDAWIRMSLHQAYAAALRRRNEYPRARAEYRKALDIASRHAPNGLAVASLLTGLGDVEESVDEYATARDLYVRALVIRQRLAPDSAAVAASLGDLGRVTAENDSADDLCARSVALWEELAPDSLEAATALNDLGAVYFQRGDVAAARPLHERALAISTRLEPGGLHQAASLYRLGNVAWRRGDLAAAEDFHRRALAIRQALAPESAAVEASLNSLGNVAGTRKDLAAAERFHRQALAIGEKRAPHAVEPMLHNLGEDARLLGDYASAEALYRRALAMYERLPEGSGRDAATANTLVSLAAVARDRGDLAEAERIARSALAIREKLEPGSLHLAEDREVLADVLRDGGRWAEARDAYERILRVASRTVPGSELEARALHALGRLEVRDGKTEQAAARFRLAVDALESQKGKLGGSTEARELFSAIYADYYRDLLEVLVDLGRPAEAFRVLERSHARLLLAMLAERDLVLASHLPPELEAERASADADYDRTQRELRELPPKEHARRAQLLDRLSVLRAKRSETVEKIKRASPRYASLRYPQPLDVTAARAALDPGTLLLSFSVGRERSFLFALEPAATGGSGLTVYTLAAGDASLRAAVGAHRNLLDLHGASSTSNADAARNLAERSRSLYATLLAPAEPLIARAERLLIVPDGPLHTLPFAALLRAGEDGAPQPLVEWKPLHTAISATVYAELKKSRGGARRDPAVMVAAFGDPRYPTAPEKKAAVLRAGLKFQPLPESRQEVQEIAALYAPRSVAYLGAEATEERARSIGRDVPLIHYACHAVVDERFPLDSALVFSIPERPREGQDNGLLQAWEIFEKMRIDADLVTLSACESGLGKEMGGEGLIGLTRAFQYAGARSVLASLWKVEDKSTAALMKRFYANLKAGRTKDEALRLAQIELIRSTEFAAPRDWAAFQLNGDWK
jgi:CHAT domain-containing protein/Tfp pilus assembly protein PilF